MHCKGKGKGHLLICHWRYRGGRRVIILTMLNLGAVRVCGWGIQRHPPAALRPGKRDERLGEPQGRSGRVWNITPPSGFEPRLVHLVASESYPTL
jgi:hypothetical protein